MRAALLIMLTPVVFCQNPTPPATGSVQGIVLDAENKPVTDATVYGLPEEEMRHRIRDTTDSAGRFVLNGVPVGGVYLHAYKESDGYPDTFFAFFARPDRPNLKIKVEAGQETKGVVIQLGPKAAYLNVEIADPNGQPPADTAQLIFLRDDIPGPHKMGGRAKESVMVPAVPFRLGVEVPGYKPWHYGGDEWQGNKGLIAPRPGESINVMVHLVRQ